MYKENETDDFIKCCQDFVDSTNTDLALAHYYLQNNQFDLKKALDDYNSQEHVVIRGFTVPKSEPDGLNRLKVLSWNLEGAETKDRANRTKAAIDVIINCDATVVLLQEFVVESEILMRDALENDYEFFTDASSKLCYFCAILIKRNRHVNVLEDSFEVNSFTKSSADRHILVLHVKVNDVVVRVMTAHLESTQEFSAERKIQLIEAFNGMKTSDLSIFAGDLNVRDKEISEIGGLPDHIVDVWEYTGERHDTRHTWDPKHNYNASICCPGASGQRFDRMYLYRNPAKDFCEKLEPIYFELEGTDKIRRGVRYPSDHWAIVAYFEL